MTSSPVFDHARPDLTGVLLVNLGTPDAATPDAVRRYLAEFLWDPRVIEAPRWLWWLALHGVILRTRPRRSAHAYASVWTSQGSPLLVHSEALAAAVTRELDPGDGRALAVALAMRYGKPAIAPLLQRWRERGLRRLLVLPLYPQYSATTTASVFDAVSTELQRWRFIPELRFVQEYATDAGYIDALTSSIAAHWRQHGRAQRLLFSFHGIPQRYFRHGDPYFCQCQATATRVARALELVPSDWQVTFQSRVGREPWLRPYTDETIRALPGKSVRTLDVVCPGFAVDCLETLEEIAMQNRDAFLAAGGERFAYVPALNAGDAHVAALTALLRRHGAGWTALARAPDLAAEQASVAERTRQQRAMQARGDFE